MAESHKQLPTHIKLLVMKHARVWSSATDNKDNMAIEFSARSLMAFLNEVYQANELKEISENIKQV